jgi:hypothetical protein
MDGERKGRRDPIRISAPYALSVGSKDLHLFYTNLIGALER